MIPLVNLKTNFENYGDDYRNIVTEVASSCAYILGPYVQEFEDNLASYLGVKHVIGVGSGTDALTLILKAFELPSKSTVLTQTNSFIASTLAVTNADYEIRLCDADENTYSMDLSEVTEKPSVVMPVHLYGRPFDCSAIKEKWGDDVIVIEDACQAHGSHLNGHMCGSFGTAAAFSFYPGKNLGAFGDGGAVATNDDSLAGEIRSLRNWGGSKKYVHDRNGGNSRLDGMQAAILNFKLKHLDEWNQKRAALAARYVNNLQGTQGLTLPAPMAEGAFSNNHLFVVQVDAKIRDAVLEGLKEYEVYGGIHYPIPIHKQVVYQNTPLSQLSLPVAEAAADRILSLPMFPDMTDEECDTVSDAMKNVLSATAQD